MYFRTLVAVLFGAALIALPASASAAVLQENGSRNASPFTNFGPVQAEGTGGAGKYVWYVDRLADEDILRGFDQSDASATTQLGVINGNVDVGPGPIGSVSAIAFSPSQNLLYVADVLNDQIIVYPRANDGTANDPVSYSSAFSVSSFNPGFPFTEPKGLAIDTSGNNYGYAAVKNGNDQRGVLVFNPTPSGQSLQWMRFVWDPGEWNSATGPGAMAIDPVNGNIYVSIDGFAKVKGYTPNIDNVAGQFVSATPGDYNSLAIDHDSNRLFAAKTGAIEVFSLKTSRLLGSATGTGFSQNLSFASLQNGGKFFLASSGAPQLRDLLVNAIPTCTPSAALDAVAGETFTFTPNCTDADASTTLEFEVLGETAIGNAQSSNNDSTIEYHGFFGETGPDEVSYRVTTQNGRSITYQQPINVIPPDTTAPVVDITAPAAEATLFSSPATLHFTVSDDRDASPLCDYADEQQVPLTEGDNTITVSCEDDSGNIGQASVSFTYVPPDTVAPEVEITAPLGGVVISPTVTLEYTVSDNVEPEPTCDIASGSEVVLEVGYNEIAVHCEDGVGNTSQDSVGVTYDADPPVVAITAPLDGALVTDATTTLNFSVSDDTDSEVNCDSADDDTLMLSPGANTIVVSCTDHAGRTGTDTAIVTYDETAPEISITAPADGSSTDSSQTVLQYTATDDVDENLDCSRNNGANVPLVAGTNTITVTCTDDAERSGSKSATVTYTPPAQVTAFSAPVVHKTANLEPTTGEVLVKLPGSDKYIPLSEALMVPVGTIVDARKGTAKLTLANQDGTTYEAEFWGGVFQVFQGSGDNPIAIMRLRDDIVDESAKSSIAHPRAAANPFREIQIAARGKKKNGLWGDGKGKFRTSGSGGSATVRGTKWYVANYENGTYFRVDRGIVNVRPTHGNCFDLKAGESRFVEYAPLTESQRIKKQSKKKSKPKKGCT